ncbi:MAG: DUF134 domain-containing protein [Candidatus Omnitrophica bacterium]|nr:DUF134 domain-containing protein [Candidatus Omnitrophota bacterium]MDD5775191.1 DUF134 domain-containing protein [Candidatus Omnitrophota bacterium]
MPKRSRGRPRKRRFIESDPKISQFSPRGRPGRPDEAFLGLDEFEAMRLAHYKGLSQADAARSMNISQQTFSRTIKRAQRAIADALVNGKTIYIQEGSASPIVQANRARQDHPAFNKLIADTRQYLSDSKEQ